MRFSEFRLLAAIINQVEPIGESAHEAVFPEISRFRKKALEKNPNPRLSAVGATFYPLRNETHIILIERQAYKGVHSGQIAFPGGKVEPTDPNFEYTAKRETEEEVGIAGKELVTIGTLTDVYIPPSGFLVKPFLFMVDKTPSFVAHPREVKSILAFPAKLLLKEDLFVNGDVPSSNGVQLHSKYIPFEDKKIWGATAMMLSELSLLLRKANSMI